ncbi:hypothetical protein TNCV_583201 [Trichonephila clavipes]|nr:hypothetical protein TNCV_583201 [Trichonephila clavipes]
MAPVEVVCAGEIRRACRPIYRTNPPKLSPWICYTQCTSHIYAEMCWRSVMLEPHPSLYAGWDTLQEVESHWDSEAWKTDAEMGRMSGIRLWDYKRENVENKSKQDIIMEESSKEREHWSTRGSLARYDDDDDLN